MNQIRSFRDLDVWQIGMDLVDCVIQNMKMMPRVEFDLKRQIQKAVIELEICFRNGYLKREDCARTLALCSRVGTMLDRLHDSLE